MVTLKATLAPKIFIVKLFLQAARRDIIVAVIDMKKFLIAMLLTLATALTPAQVFASDAWAIAAEALGVLAAYQSTLKQMLALGNNVNAQMAVRKQDIEENGVDPNKRDIEIVDSI